MDQQSENSLIYRLQEQNLEGEIRVVSNKFLRISKLKACVLFPLSILLSAFIVLLLVRKNKRVLSWLTCQQCTAQEATYVLIEGKDASYTLETVKDQCFFYHRVKYSISTIKPISYNFQQSEYFYNKMYSSEGLSVDQHNVNSGRFGFCEHPIQIPGLFNYLIDQLLGIFFILQYITCAIYILEEFISFASIMLACSLLTTTVNYFMLRSSYLKIKQIAEVYTTVEVIRDGKIQQISSKLLVPGDVFVPKQIIPCDCVLISGEAFLNEVNMTGQNIPIAKSAYQTSNKEKLSSIYWLYEGSVLLQSKGNVLALVVHTGFITKKGKIFRKILSGESRQPQFFKYAFMFLIQLFIYCLIIFCALIPMMKYNNISSSLILLRFFDMIGWAIPPALPIFFNVCYTVSMYRLRQESIFGTQPFKTIVSGKVRTMCFDKTGTLTKNSMSLNSIIEFEENKSMREVSVGSNNQSKSISDLMDKILGSCHSVRLINNQLMGDQLDLRMFLFSQYLFQHTADTDIKLNLKKQNVRIQVLRINQFQSKFQDMSVLVRQGQNHYVFIKGSPQKIHSLSVQKHPNFDSILSRISLSGLRCLGVGYKKIANPSEYLNCSREQFGKKITICGLLTFTNQLKEGCLGMIRKMSEGQIETKIITGDNIYVAVQTAIKCGIVQESSPVMILRGDKQKGKETLIAERITVSNKSVNIDQVQFPYQQYLASNLVPLAVDQQFIRLYPEYQQNIKIFARITPEGKASIIRRLVKLKQIKWENQSTISRLFSRTAQKIGMCGDGANDLMAIKQADLGIGISHTDSSFASDFSIPQIDQLDLVILQGKATLQNVIQIFQYYTGISILKYVSAMICVTDKSSFTDNMYTYLNYASTLQIVLFLTFSKPASKMTFAIPNDNLMGLENHLLFLVGTIFQCAGLIGIQQYIIRTDGFQPVADSYFEKWDFTSQLTTAMFLSSHILMILRTFWVFKGYPWKKEIYYNYLLLPWMILIIGANFPLFFLTKYLNPFFGIVELEWRVQIDVLGITLGVAGVLLIWKIVINLIKLYQK